jgi:hypothetical protein
MTYPELIAHIRSKVPPGAHWWAGVRDETVIGEPGTMRRVWTISTGSAGISSSTAKGAADAFEHALLPLLLPVTAEKEEVGI